MKPMIKELAKWAKKEIESPDLCVCEKSAAHIGCDSRMS
jgi:hypothetical protein